MDAGPVRRRRTQARLCLPAATGVAAGVGRFWVEDEIIEELVTKAPAGTRFVFVRMSGDDEEAAR
jgi:hypothetical protein